MKPIQMVDLKGQYERIKPEIDAAMQQALDSWALINGPEVKDFGKNLGSYLNINHAIPCGNGTDALQIALMALGLKPGDEVITVPFTFIATAEVISLLQLKPVFVDIEERSFNMDVDQLESAITEKTKCIIPVHLFGQSADMKRINEIAGKYGVPVVEDNAQSIGAEHIGDGQAVKVGTTGTIGCTSFYPSKTLGAYGDGGALFTNDDELAEKIRVITNHGSKVKYYHEEVGVNSRLDNIQAAVLNVKLKYLDDYIDRRQHAANYYDTKISESLDEVAIPSRVESSTHVFHQYTLQVSDRDNLQNYLKERNIPSMVYYPVPLHMQKAYTLYGYKEGDYPVSEKVSKKVISLPMHTELEDEQLEFITNSIVEFYQNVAV